MKKSIKTEIVINASRQKVWNILTQFDRYPEWNPFLTSITGQLATGNRLTNTMRHNDKQFVFKPIVQQVIPYRYFDWIGHLWFKGIFDGHHYFEIEEQAPNQVKLIHGEHFSGILSSPILKKVENDTRLNFIKMNQAIRTISEKN